MGILTPIYLFFLLGLFCVTRYRRRWYTAAKAAVSSLFVVCGAWGIWAGERLFPLAIGLVMAALVLCAAGDVMLGLANRSHKLRTRPFLAGVVLFLAAHILLCAALYLRDGAHLYDAVLPLISLAALWGLERAGLIRLKRMRGPAYLYTLFVALMATKAVSTALTLGPLPGFVLAGGGVLFYLSDVVLLFLYFGTVRHKALRYGNLGTYYLGIYLLAVSTYWM